MGKGKTSLKNKQIKTLKYFIFSFAVFCAFFVMQLSASATVKADGSATFEIIESNYNGKDKNGANTSTNAVYVCENGDTDTNCDYHLDTGKNNFGSGWYAQSRGVEVKDTVSLKLVITTDLTAINGLVVFESNYSGSAGTNASYDSYKKVDNAWVVVTGSGLKTGKVVTGTCSALDAGSTELAANGGSLYSMMCINEETDADDPTKLKITINYVYTIRSGGYGEKIINFAIYNDDPYDYANGQWNDAITTGVYDVRFVASKPANDFIIQWLDTASETCATSTTTGITGSPATDNVCVKYVNKTGTNKGKDKTTMTFVLPKELAYYHDVTETALPSNDGTNHLTNQTEGKEVVGTNVKGIPNNTIYAVNTFTNVGTTGAAAGKQVKYYYDRFYETNTSTYNYSLDPTIGYELSLVIDASGNYKFYITDIFGNRVSNNYDSDNTNDVKVEDVYITLIIVDFTNETELTIMSATSGYTDSDWHFEWLFTIDTTSINFANMEQTDAEVIAYIFQKILIAEGEYAANLANVEDIAKEPLGFKGSGNTDKAKINEIKIWRVVDKDDIDYETSNVSHEITCAVDCFSVGDYSAGEKNKLTFTAPYNGRYRVMISDTYTNTTDAPPAGSNGERNPSVDVTVIDRTTPIISSDLADSGINYGPASTSINTFPYVNGGGEKDSVIPTNLSAVDDDQYYEIPDNYTNIYYNVAGNKIFNYQDALEIAKIRVVDQVKYFASSNLDTLWTGWNVHMNALNGTNSDGAYVDPSANMKSDRNASGSTTGNDLHAYIINNNITSFTGGLVKQVGAVEYDAASAPDASKLNASVSTTGLAYVNSTGNFQGYLKIVFEHATNSSDTCTITINADGSAPATNKTCFEMMNKRIDDVEDFKMTFSAVDYLGNASNEYVVNVSVIDTTNPGISTSLINYTNTYTNSLCRLEIGNVIQDKAKLLECYGIKNNTTYYYKDNNVYYDSGVDKQYYDNYPSITNGDYFNKIYMEVLEEGTWQKITDTITPQLNKSGDHQMRIVFADHWSHWISSYATYDTRTDDAATVNRDERNNNLVVYVNYYVNPRTLLIEPLANEKMYGEGDPEFAFCVYVNKHNNTFNLESKFFEPNFINTYFDNIYCTKDVYGQIVPGTNTYTATEKVVTPYTYNEYAQNSSAAINEGEYVKINNTYVKIVNAKRYSKTYEVSATGNFFSLDGGTTVYPIKNGYKYNDATCTEAYKEGIDAADSIYFKYSSTGCEKITASNVYKEKYTQNSNGDYLKYNDNDASSGNAANANTALVNGNKFQGKLTRVESSCYNNFDRTASGNDKTYADYMDTCTDVIGNRNDNVGKYHIALGTLSIEEGASTNYNEDYVIKINTNYFANTFSLGGNQLSTRVITGDDGKLVDDRVYAESTVDFTIRQAVLTIKANGSNKRFGEQDPFSHNWNNTTTEVNVSDNGYLGGYTVVGWRNSDLYSGNDTALDDDSITNDYIISGYLRRAAGEEVGVYDICNVLANPKSVDTTECTKNPGKPISYDNSANDYNFAAYGLYNADGSTTGTQKAALTIRTNAEIYGTPTGRTLNSGTRNYAIVFIKNVMTIQAVDIVIQPGINQGKEYAASPYNDPLWELVVYGESIYSNDGSTWETRIDVSADESNFTGYTKKINVENNGEERTFGVAPYNNDTQIYYTRRKVSPDVNYSYTENLTLKSDKTDRYKKSGNYYYKDTTGEYVYAYGKYYEVSASAASAGVLTITVQGRLVNETYTLFDSNFKVTREGGENVGWYTYDEIKNYVDDGGIKYTIKPVTSRGTQSMCVVEEGSISLNNTSSVLCRNYNVNYIDNAPKAYDETNNLYNTVQGDTEVYKPDGEHECTNADIYSLVCPEAKKTKITFEIFKREIILEFIDDNYTFIYGERYKYYDGGTATSSSAYTYNNNASGIFYIDNANSEGDIFLCYSDLGDYLVDCTQNEDYGLTKNDTWTNIGLKFYLHSVVSEYDNDYYGKTGDKAVPAGTYYVYAEIGQTGNAAKDTAAKNNYKFTYRGGTLTIAPKVTSIQLTSYAIEYGEDNFYSFGTGSNYSEYNVYTNQCMTQKSYTDRNSGNVLESLITDCSTATDNVVGNTYGFVVEGLDGEDLISENFVGRPAREVSRTGNKGKFDDVGFYEVTSGSINTKKDTNVTTAVFKECTATAAADKTNNCVYSNTPVVTNGVNYDISYSVDSYSSSGKDRAYIFITPAKLDITVDENQTKMYGCAYYKVETTTGNYYTGYTYEDGYSNCKDYSATGETATPAVDVAYGYTVAGDKDVNSDYYVTNNAAGERTTAVRGNKYDTTQEVVLGNTSLLDNRLYRVKKVPANSYEYSTIRGYDPKTKYQDQSVGVYTITLGNLNVEPNVNANMCDPYNNPVLSGGTQCRNYNINYYGSSTTTADETHEYNDTKTISAESLARYVLNYVTATAGEYINVNGTFIKISDLKADGANNVFVNSYVAISGLQKYKKVSTYVEDSTCTGDSCYIYLDGAYKTISSISALRYKANGNAYEADTGGAYVKVTKGTDTKYVLLSTFTKYKAASSDANHERDGYIKDSNGEYVKLLDSAGNGSFVQLSSLQKYAEASGKYTSNASGTYILTYKSRPLSEFTRYNLSGTGNGMYKHNQDADVENDNVFVFVDGAFVPYKSLNIDASGNIVANMARTVDESNVLEETRGDATTKTNFTITARIVYVHTEFNLKPFGEDDPVEYITCAELNAAYGRDCTKYTGYTENYKAADGTKPARMELGVSMYYAVQNSLAKAPWTEWTDGASGDSTLNDIQFDALRGKISRKMGPNNGKYDVANRYTYDFANVTNVGALHGENYMIVHATMKDLENTYVETSSSTRVSLAAKLHETCANGDDYCANNKKIKNNSFKLYVDGNGYVVDSATGNTLTSISLIDKYDAASDGNRMDYWYLGFYKTDVEDENRYNMHAKWWTSRSHFEKPYDEFRATQTADGKGEHITDPYFEAVPLKEVYFEIIRRTIYLYAVDIEKVYGTADNYQDFQVAICGNDEGYIVDGTGIKCKNPNNRPAYGLGEDHVGIFMNGLYMNQNQIKNKGAEGNYIFHGAADGDLNSFGIYFRRTEGENAGSYTITACATQSDISDCTDKSQTEKEGQAVNVIGDNYKVIEVSGVLTIKPRTIDVTPTANQGFQYGNYTEDGNMPNITFTEKYGSDQGLVHYKGDKSGVYLMNGNDQYEITTVNAAGELVNEFTIGSTTYYISGLDVFEKTGNNKVARIAVSTSDSKNTKTVTINSVDYKIVQKSLCFIDVSGKNTVCINDAQNEALANISTTDSKYYEYVVAYGTALDTQINIGTSTTPSYKKVKDFEKDYQSYDVYGDSYSNPANLYSRDEADTRHALNLQCGTNTAYSRYSRDVCDYKIVKGEDFSISENVKNTISFYVQIMRSKVYTRSGSEGSYTYTLVTDEAWEDDSFNLNSGDYFIKYASDGYAQITAAKRYKIDQNNAYVQDNEGSYLSVSYTAYNYKMGTVDESKLFKVTAAKLTVTPVEKQYKIYGDADPEIKFTMETEYTVADTHYQAYTANIIALYNGATAITGDAIKNYRYGANGGVANADGDYILLTKGWKVVLNSFAYSENSGVSQLDYGKNLPSVKHTGSAVTINQAAGDSVTHYDKYTEYNDNIETTRILIGNLYVDSHNQNVGERNIVNGMKVGKNNLHQYNSSAVNYNLHYVSKLFVIIPRPVNVEIADITKTYGQATDSESCESYDTECIVGEGILTDGAESLLVNNFNVLDDKTVADATLNSTNVTGIPVTYGSEINMPTKVSVAAPAAYSTYVSVTLGGYYTASGNAETKNANLNIKVERENYNIARQSDACLMSGETYCEDVGEYFLSFNHRSEEANTKESTIVSGYYGRYWGYNPNYYVVVYNNFNASAWDATYGYTNIAADNNELYYTNVIKANGSGYNDPVYTTDAKPARASTLKILKRDIEIVVETIDSYSYEQSNTGKYLKIDTKYYLITTTNTYKYDSVTEKYIQSSTGTHLCTYVANNTNRASNCAEIVAGNRYDRTATRVAEKYSIEQDMDVPRLPSIDNSDDRHHTTYDTTNHTGYITWYEQPRQVRTGDILEGEVAYCTTTFALTADLDTIRSNNCSEVAGQSYSGTLKYYNDTTNPNDRTNPTTFFDTHNEGRYIITRDKTKLYVTNATDQAAKGDYEKNNYTTTFVNGVLQIDIDETAPVINVGTEFVTKNANDGTMSKAGKGNVLSFLEKAILRTNHCASLISSRDENDAVVSCKDGATSIVFTTENPSLQTEYGGTAYLEWDDVSTILDWFNITSYDPGLIRAGQPVSKRYDPRWYISIQNDFDQRKTGDYTIFVYAQDRPGNISLATTVTLRIIDDTAPVVGTMNLYDAKVKCGTGAGVDCNVEDNWVVAEQIYLPVDTIEANLSGLTTAEVSAIRAKIGSTKYIFSTITATYEESADFGTYYKVPVDTLAKAVKHRGWTNASSGIWMTVLGGDDNSLTYLDTSRYAERYTIDGDDFEVTEDGSGANLLLGSLIKLDNLTKYRLVKLDANGDESATGTVTMFIPDISGTYIRFKGYYYNVKDGGYYNASGGAATEPDSEYRVKLYKKTGNIYEATSTATYNTDKNLFEPNYYLRDGEFYEIPTEKYSSYTDAASKIQYKHDSTGKFVNFAQWDTYYSRDGGNSWILYSRDMTTNGYLALGQDGQRLIMIKAVDTGFVYAEVEHERNYINVNDGDSDVSDDNNIYCSDNSEGTCAKWNDAVVNKGYSVAVSGSSIVLTPVTTDKLKEFNGTKTYKYNISAWEDYSASGNRDMKFAYLDTIMPVIDLNENQHLEVFEYGCSNVSNCSTNHDEKFGTAVDSYVYPLNKLMKYDGDGNALTFGSTIVNGTTQVMVNRGFITITAERRLNKNEGKTKACVGSGDCMYTQSNTGEYIYLGATDTVVTAHERSNHIAGRLNGTKNYTDGTTDKLQVYDQHAGAVYVITTMPTASNTELAAKLQANTWYEESGVGVGETDTFDGIGNEAIGFGTVTATEITNKKYVADKYTTILVYANVLGGTADVENHPYYSARGHYKYKIEKDGTTYDIKGCYSSSAFVEDAWCNSPTTYPEANSNFADIKSAMNTLMKVYDATDNYDFHGNDITFTIDYRLRDLAGNVSQYERKGVLLSSFTRTTAAVDPVTLQLTNHVAVNAIQNEDITQLLSNFKVTTTTGKSLRSNERILQTVYYNGEVIAEREKYDLGALSNIDTSTPGEYRIVYNIERKDGTVYVQGNEVELVVTISPNVAQIGANKTDIMMIAMIVMGVSVVAATSCVVIFKKKED